MWGFCQQLCEIEILGLRKEEWGGELQLGAYREEMVDRKEKDYRLRKNDHFTIHA